MLASGTHPSCLRATSPTLEELVRFNLAVGPLFREWDVPSGGVFPSPAKSGRCAHKMFFLAMSGATEKTLSLCLVPYFRVLASLFLWLRVRFFFGLW